MFVSDRPRAVGNFRLLHSPARKDEQLTAVDMIEIKEFAKRIVECKGSAEKNLDNFFTLGGLTELLDERPEQCDDIYQMHSEGDIALYERKLPNGRLAYQEAILSATKASRI